MPFPVSYEQSSQSSDGERYYTVAQAARKLQVHRSTVLRWIEAGKLVAYRVGSRAVRIKERDLERAITPVASPKGVILMKEHDQAHVRVPSVPRRVTDGEVKRGLAALAQARLFTAQMQQRRGGQLLPSSADLIRQEREERSNQL